MKSLIHNLRNTLLILIAGGISNVCLADIVYINDVIYVPLRGGQSSEYRILHKGLKSGTRLERLEENDESGFSRVRTPGGLEGWIQTQYLVSEPIAKDQLELLKDKYAKVEAQYQNALAQLEQSSDAESNATRQIASLSDKVTTLESQLEEITKLASNQIQLKQQNVELQSGTIELKQQITELSTANNNLRTSNAHRWYMLGAGTAFGALVLGLILGRQAFSRKDRGWA